MNITRDYLRKGGEFLYIKEPATIIYTIKGTNIYFRQVSDKKANFYAALLGIQTDCFYCRVLLFGQFFEKKVMFSDLARTPELKLRAAKPELF